MKQDNPFLKLGALDQKLYQDTSAKQQEPRKQNTGNPEFQRPSILENQQSSSTENLNTSIPEIQKPRVPVIQNSAKRAFFTKATYRLCDEALAAVDDAKNILKRQYKVKVNLEEIVETAVLEIFRDLTENKDNSILVTKYSGNPETQNT
jgi:hypothetical protein